LKLAHPPTNVYESVLTEGKKASGTRTEACLKIPNKIKLIRLNLRLLVFYGGEESTVLQIKGNGTRVNK